MSVLFAILMSVPLLVLGYVIIAGILFIPTYILLRVTFSLLGFNKYFKCDYVFAIILISFLVRLLT